MFFAQSDWFLYLVISGIIHFRAKQDGSQFCLNYKKRTFFNQWSRRDRQYHKSNEIWRESIQRLLFSDKCSQDVFKMFCLQIMSRRQAHDFGKILLNILKNKRENNYARYMLKQLLTSMSVNCVDIFTSRLRGSVNIHHYSPPLRWIIVLYMLKT